MRPDPNFQICRLRDLVEEAYPHEPSAGLRTTFRSWAPREEAWAVAVPVGRRDSGLRWHTALGPTTEEAALAATAAHRRHQ